MKIELLNTEPLYYENEKDLCKEVVHPAELLQKIANHYSDEIIKLTDEHSNEIIGFVKGISYEDEKLFVDVPNDIDMKGRGISTRADVKIDAEDEAFFYATAFGLRDIAITDTPRTRILCNSLEGDKKDPKKDKDGVQTLLDELNEKNKEIDKLKKQNEKLLEDNKKVSKYKNKLEENKEFLESKDEILARITKYDNEAKAKQINEIADKYQFDTEKEEELAIIEKIMKKDVDLTLMEELAERRAIIKQEEDFIRDKKPKGTKLEVDDLNLTDIKKKEKEHQTFKNRDEYDEILKEIGLNSEIGLK
ncbi:MAG: hypothetical protein FWC41_10830 [Firmicutes bacterium]|nr:hypothetical protein [Bacillota bacterium]